jgi:hypothetical protein
MGITDTMVLELSGGTADTAPTDLRPEQAENRARAWLSRRMAWEDRMAELQPEG